MNRTDRIIRAGLAMTITVALCLLLIAHTDRDRAAEAHASAQREHAAIAAQLAELRALSRRQAVALDRPAPADDLIQRFRAAARAAGGALRQAEPRNLSLAPPEPAGSSGLLRQRVTLTVAQITPGDLATLLNAWSEREPLWTVTVARLTASDRADRQEQSITNRFDAQLTLEAVYAPETTIMSPQQQIGALTPTSDTSLESAS